MNEQKKRKSQAGFTLIEILIVLSLVAVAGTFVVTQLVDRLDEGNVMAAKTQIQNFKTILEDYRRYCNQYPTTEQGLDSLVNKPTAQPDCPNYPATGFIQGKLPQDSWGHNFIYESDGKTYVITSYGKDGKEGGEGTSKDIKSNEL